MKQIAQLALVLISLFYGAAHALEAETLIPPEALQQDLKVMQDAIAATHPDPGIYASPESLRKAYAHVAEQLQQPLTRDQAWRVMTQLNPVFSDGHMGIVQADWPEQTRAHVKDGGVLLPFEIQVFASGEMRIRSGLDGKASPLAGRRIEQINGIPASRIVRELLPLSTGDTPEMRANMLSRRMWFYYWKVFGAPKRFDLVLDKPGARLLSVAGSAELPLYVTERDQPQFDRLFRFEIVGKDAALLTINHFEWTDMPAFYAFTEKVFTTLRDARIGTLIIDVRGNTGGNDDMWKFGIVRYLADKPYRNGSSAVWKVLAGRAKGTERVGDVMHGFASLVEPEPDHPLHFSGKTYVLVGRLTYSSAILFSNAIQDFGLGQLVGAAGYANVRQSGGVQYFTLPNTRLEISVPRFVIDRPSGERRPVLVQPDIVLPDSPFDKRALINALLKKIAADARNPLAKR